jgi:phosphatidylserine/phosphatidylglycerophosphate/cardiolipin synthase-like enzyme
MRKNAEANVAVYNRGFAQTIEAMIADDLLSAERFTKEKWSRRGLPARFGEVFSRLFSENY